MSKFKKKFAKRILAYILSGAMIMSNMTAFASESSDDTGGGYIEEVADTDDVGIEEAEEAEEAEKDENSEETEKTDESEKTDKEEANTENDTATTVETKETQTSETKSSSSVDKEDTVDEEDTTEADEKNEDVKAAATLTADMVKVGGKPVAANGKAEYTVEYNDEAIEPEVSIENCIKDTDFTVSYKDNNAAGTATITVTPVADSQQLTGDAVEITFEITAKVIVEEANQWELNISNMTKGDITTDGKLGDSNFEGYKLSSSKKFTVEDNEKSIDGFNFTKTLKLGGAGKVNESQNKTERTIKFTPERDGIFVVYAITGSSSDLTRELIIHDGTKETSLGVAPANIGRFTYNVSAGTTYYLYSKKSGINLYYLAIEEPVDLVATTLSITVEDKDGGAVTSPKYTGDAYSVKTTVTQNSNNKTVASWRYKVTYEKKNTNNEWSAVDELTNAGTYRVKVEPVEGSGLTNSKIGNEIVIGKADLEEMGDKVINHTPNEAGTTGEYDIAALFADVTGADTLEYALDENAAGYGLGNIITNPAIDAQGKLTYTLVSEKPETVTPATLVVKVTSENYNEKTFTITVNMKEKVPVTVKLKSQTHVYNGEAYDFADEVEITNVTGDNIESQEDAIKDLKDNLSYKYQLEDEEAASEAPKDAGVYKVTIELASASAYTLKSSETDATLTISPKPLKLKANDAQWDKLVDSAPASRPATSADYSFEAIDGEDAGLITGDEMVTEPTIKYYKIYTDENSPEMTDDDWKALENGDTVDIVLSGADAGKNYEITGYEKGTCTTLIRVVDTSMTTVPEAGATLTLSKSGISGSITENKLSNDGFFLVNADSKNKVDSDSSKGLIKTAGLGNQFYRSIGFKTSKPAKVEITCTSANNASVRPVVIAKLNDDNTTVTETIIDYASKDSKTMDKVLEEEGTYFVYATKGATSGSDGGINISQVKISYDGVVISKKVSVTPTISADDLEKLDGAKVYFTATGETDTEVVSGTAVELKADTAYTLAVKKNGAVVNNLTAKIDNSATYTPTEDASVTITISRIEDSDITGSGTTPESGETTETGTTPESGGTTETGTAPESSETTETGTTPESSATIESGDVAPSQSEESSDVAPGESEDSSDVAPSESEEESEEEDTKITADKDKDSVIPVNSNKIKIEAANLVEAKKPQYAVTVTYTFTDKDGKTYQQQLTEGEHYTVALVKGYDGIAVGQQKVTISGTGVKTDLGTFTSQKTVSYNIEAKKTADKNKNIAKVKLALNKNAVKNAVYTGSYITPSVDGLDSIDEANYKLVYKNNVNVGKASVTIIGQGEYYGSKVLTFSIKKADISKVTPIASNVDFSGSGKAYTAAAKQNKADALEYKGNAITFQNLALMYGDVKLNPRTDYTIDYKKNTQAGTATATIKGINNYSGSVKITYAITANSEIAGSLEKFTETNPLSAEFSSKGARLTSMTVNGITLKENTDYKVKYGKDCTTAAVGDTLTVTVTGAGSYKNAFKDAAVSIKVVPGKYHVKDGTVADKAKATDKTKLINAAKITDASGAKVKPADVEIDMEKGVTTTSITVVPATANAANYETTIIPCRVATKLSSVKQDKTSIEKVFDGVNTVTLTEKEIAEHLPNVEATDIRVLSYKNNNKLGGATVTIEGRPASAYYGTANVKFKIVAKKTELGTDADEAPDVVDTGKLIDVWDFAAGATALDDNGVPTEYLSAAKYNNMLTEDIINSWYEGVAAGSTGVEIGSFQVKDENGEVIFEFNGNGKMNNRIRTKNTKITRKDEKSLKDADGNEYLGYVYSNSSSQPNVYVGIKLDAGDIVTAVVSSNGGDSLIKFEPVDGSGSAQEYQYKSGNAGIATFYAAQAGEYKIYSVDEKLVVARIMVEKTDLATVSGSVTAPESLKDYAISFTCRETGAVKTAAVSDGKYSIDLNEGYTYDVALSNANGYIVTNENTNFVLKTGLGSFTYDVTIASVDLVTVQGSIKGLAAVAGGIQKPLEAVKLTFESGNIYVPEFTLSSETGEFTLILEKGVEYTVTAEGVDDFTLQTAKISASADGAQDITFEAKPVYDITISPEGVTKETLAATSFIFSKVNVKDGVKEYEEGYVYTFTGTDGIKLRDGQYEIKVGADCPYAMKVTSNLKVVGSNVEKVIKFDPTPKTSWDFKADDYTGQASFGGLTITGGRKHGAQYGMSIGNGTIEVPVSGPCTIIVSVGYNWDIGMEGSETKYTDKTNSGDKDVTFAYAGEAGKAVITAGSEFTSYIKQIRVESNASKAEYKEKVTVGATGCDYTTINDALAAVRNMDRTDSQRVTIEIQPGDYEEMLVVDTPNVTLKNANTTPSIMPINKGVDIEASSVRITSYYGHGYAYYSMGEDCKWNADILAANKENGCLSFTNPGTGTTSGSYWNATVVIDADGFEADGIIFENSFNQYVSKKAADDVIVPLSGAKEGSTPRASMSAGDTTVQDKKYVERAAALAIKDAKKKINFNNCSFIGRQDTLYGGTNVTAAFYDCDIYGGTDYIFGGMTAVFAKCDLVFNTMEDNNDVGYITAAQTKSGRGYLMYNCKVTSTTPGVNTASAKTSKPGYLGRPWEANTGEALFYKTIIGKTDFNGSDESLIVPEAWNAGLGGKSALSQEYASIELAGVDNSAKRVDWSNVLAADAEGNVTLADGNTKVTDATVVAAFLGEWNPFEGKDMTISNGQ